MIWDQPRNFEKLKKSLIRELSLLSFSIKSCLPPLKVISNPISNVNSRPDTCQNVISQFHGRKVVYSGPRRYRILQIIALGHPGNQARTELFRMKLVQLLAKKKRLEILIKNGTHLIFPELRISDFFCVFLRYRIVMNCVFR